jgi:hypothetical protein
VARSTALARLARQSNLIRDHLARRAIWQLPGDAPGRGRELADHVAPLQ